MYLRFKRLLFMDLYFFIYIYINLDKFHCRSYVFAPVFLFNNVAITQQNFNSNYCLELVLILN